jgi:hypothetical protein
LFARSHGSWGNEVLARAGRSRPDRDVHEFRGDELNRLVSDGRLVGGDANGRDIRTQAERYGMLVAVFYGVDRLRNAMTSTVPTTKQTARQFIIQEGEVPLEVWLAILSRYIP